MLARIVYFHRDNVPTEEIIAANRYETALNVAKEHLKRWGAVSFEIELIA